MGSKILAFALGMLIAQVALFLILWGYKTYKNKRANSKKVLVIEPVIESNVEKITRFLGFNPYEYTTITKLYNKLEKQKTNLPKTCPKAVHTLYDTINRNSISGGEKTAVVFNPDTLYDLLNTSVTGSRREQLIRKYSKEQ